MLFHALLMRECEGSDDYKIKKSMTKEQGEGKKGHKLHLNTAGQEKQAGCLIGVL